MSDYQPGSDREPMFGSDLEYDLAHEHSDAGATGRQENYDQHVVVVTATPGYDGDYSYDLAHDIPGR